MKIIVTEDKIISLENVKSVEKRSIDEERHTKMGKPYYLYNTSIHINYFGGDTERIYLDGYTSSETAKKELETLIQRIYVELVKE